MTAIRKSTQNVSLFLGLALLTGCVASSKYNDVLQDFAACDQERKDVQKEAEKWHSLYQQELDRWVVKDTNAEEAVRLVNEKIQSIRVELPPLVQQEVVSHLNDLAAYLGEEFTHLVKQSTALQARLDETTEKLTSIEEDMATLDEMRGLLDEARARRAKLAGAFTEILRRLRDWDRTRLHCKKCDEYLGLGRKKREEVVRFHGQVTGKLSELQAQLTTE
jgi:predicted nuclease with TOPRIM domain